MRLLITVLLLSSSIVHAQQTLEACPRDMNGISTTPHQVLTANGRDRIGFSAGGLGNPDSDSQNWLNAIYNNFLTPQAQGHFFYSSQIYSAATPLMTTNDSEFELGMCSTRGQCVQAFFQVEFSSIPVAGYLRRGVYRFIIPARIQTVPSAANVRYIAPGGQQYSQTYTAVNGVLPVAQPITHNSPRQPDCLDNDGNVTRTWAERTGDDEPDRDDRGEQQDDDNDYWVDEEEEAYGGTVRSRCGISSGSGGLPGQEYITSTRTCN